MKYKDIISLGRHRLMCGDATSFDDVEALIDRQQVDLVLTDPPYGINYVGVKPRAIGGATFAAKKSQPVLGDLDSNTLKHHWRIARSVCAKYIIWGGQNFTDALPPTYGWLVWNKDKNTESLSFGDGELAWSNVINKLKIYTFKWNGAAGRDMRLNPSIHPTQKPVELHMKILEDFTNPGDIILDCFGGSGTTLIACELTGRTCLMMEISPEYCDVIKTRYETLTAGAIPGLLEAANAGTQ